jgi:uncharacterized protein YehS (DUF1456 family)
MTTNDILRRTRYAFDFRDTYMMELFASGGVVISKEQLKAWLLKDEYDGFKEATHKELAVFLNGLINEKRGKKEGPQPEPMNWQDEDILETLMLGDMKFSKHELSALFRKPTHTHYRLCKDQLIRKLLIGMHRRYRPSTATNTTEL